MKRLLIFIALASILMGCMNVEENPSLPSSSKIDAVILKENDTYKLYIVFTLPNPCHKIVYKGLKAYSDKILIYYEYIPPKPDVFCIQKIEVFNTTVNLGNLREGSYTVYIYVNEKVVKKLQFYVSKNR